MSVDPPVCIILANTLVELGGLGRLQTYRTATPTWITAAVEHGHFAISEDVVAF